MEGGVGGLPVDVSADRGGGAGSNLLVLPGELRGQRVTARPEPHDGEEEQAEDQPGDGERRERDADLLDGGEGHAACPSRCDSQP